MAFLGGDSQSNSQVSSIIDFSPYFNFGDDNTSDFYKSSEQTSAQSPRQDGSLGLSASVGVAGGSGGTASTSRLSEEDNDLDTSKENAKGKPFSFDPKYALFGLGTIGLLYYMNSKKGK